MLGLQCKVLGFRVGTNVGPEFLRSAEVDGELGRVPDPGPSAAGPSHPGRVVGERGGQAVGEAASGRPRLADEAVALERVPGVPGVPNHDHAEHSSVHKILHSVGYRLHNNK